MCQICDQRHRHCKAMYSPTALSLDGPASAFRVRSNFKLPEGIVLDRETLFSAFQKIADGESVQELRDVDGTKRDLKIEMDDQSAFLTFGATGSRSLVQPCSQPSLRDGSGRCPQS